MTGFIASVFLFPNRVSHWEAFEVLEPDDGKLSRPVLRGLDPSNGVRLLGDNPEGSSSRWLSSAGAHLLGGHPNEGLTGGCSRSTELPIVALKRSWRQTFRWETGRRVENRIWPGLAVTTEAQDSRAVGTARHMSHRTIDPQCLENPRPRWGGT
jgi:hypothetical protein